MTDRLLNLAAASVRGVLFGSLGGLVVAQPVPKCGEDCFAFTGGLVVGGAFAGACIFVGLVVLCRGHGSWLAWLGIALLCVTLAVSAKLATLSRFSQMRDSHGSYQIDARLWAMWNTQTLDPQGFISLNGTIRVKDVLEKGPS